MPPNRHRHDEIPAPVAIAIHQFGGGSGRTARLLMNDHRLRRGDPHAIISVEKRSAYLAALEDANAGNCEPFASFILECVMDSIVKLIGDT